MLTPKLLNFTVLRRSLPLCSIPYSPSQSLHPNFIISSSPPSVSRSPPMHSTASHLLTPYNILFIRSFSSGDSTSHSGYNSAFTQSDVISGIDGSDIGSAGAVGVAHDEMILPVSGLISLLDGYHDLTGFPWWLVIASSTLALRVALFPFVVLQLRKLKRIGELFPTLPPPFPPPLSERTFRYQFALFQKERKALGCPSFLWFVASLAVQVPSFLLWITTVRRMSLDQHLGFDCGGILWFQDLTQYPNGVFGPIFPFLIAGLHYVNVQVSFHKSSIGEVPGLFGTLAKYYKKYLEFLTVPLLFITFNIPQGSLIYWLTNSSLTLVQQLVLKHPDVRKKLGLPDKEAPVTRVAHDENVKSRGTQKNPSGVVGRKTVQKLTPKELVALSVKLLSEGQKDKAIPIIRLALEKDPEHVRALLIMGQTLLQTGLLTEAIEYLERAISKLLIAGFPCDIEDVDLLILSSTWTGSAYIRQGKNKEGLAHLERIAHIKEPEDAKSKAHYCEGLLMLSSALYGAGRKVEAAEHLRRAAAYDDRYKEFLEQCEKDEDEFVDELVNSRRSDR
ncbi:hypothetical protein M9H77_36169 [Catharanthus roseus]|uniref:Uncharacterized protein n=1 Tax=Catharanthus roseus TaxID=4058 RepID=A0ACB9ZR39_CATRO|nr:hypothetical protein M9H77_36169 [Catharanthus roseus]